MIFTFISSLHFLPLRDQHISIATKVLLLHKATSLLHWTALKTFYQRERLRQTSNIYLFHFKYKYTLELRFDIYCQY